MKNLIGNEIHERDEAKIKEIFPKRYHSFYGNIWFNDVIVMDKESISVKKLLSIDPKLKHKYVLFFNGRYSTEEDQQKLTDFVLYLLDLQVYTADIDFVFFKNKPKKSAENVPNYYVSNSDVDKVIKVQAKEFREFKNKKDIESFFWIMRSE
jgi:hypothetical protein